MEPTFSFTSLEELDRRVNSHADKLSLIATIPAEGVVIRSDSIEGRMRVYKVKNHAFKVMEGIVKTDGSVDMEESS